MGLFDLPTVEEGIDIEETVRNLFDAMHKFKKELEFILANIDSANIGSVDGASGVLADPQRPREKDVKNIVASALYEGTGINIVYSVPNETITVSIKVNDIKDTVNDTIEAGKGIKGTYNTETKKLTLDVDISTVSAPAEFNVGDGDIGGLTVSSTYDAVEVKALRDKCEALADDCRALRDIVADLISKLKT